MRRFWRSSVFASLVWMCPGWHAEAVPFRLPDGAIQDKRHTQAATLLQQNRFADAAAHGQELIAKNPQDRIAHLLVALAQVGMGQFNKSLQQVEAVRAFDPSYASEILNNIARFYLSKGRSLYALRVCEKSLAIKPNEQALQLKAEIFVAQGRFPEALGVLEKLPPTVGNQLQLSRIHLSRREFLLAAIRASNVIKTDPANRGGLLLLATAQMLGGKLDSAREGFEPLAKSQSENPLAAYSLGLLDLLQGNHEAAAHAFGSLVAAHPAYLDAHLGEAAALLMSGKLDSSLAASAKALAASRNHPIGHLLQAAAYSAKSQPEAVDAALRNAAGSFPDFGSKGFTSANFGGSEPAAGWKTLAISEFYLGAGFATPTVEWIDRYLGAAKSANPFVNITKARAKSLEGKAAEANEMLEKLADSQPKLAAPHAERGNLAIARNEIGAAAKHYQAAIARAPESPLLHVRFGEVCYQLGQIDSALASFKKVTELAPESPIGYNQFAWTLATRRNGPAEALPFAEKARQLAPNDPAVVDTLGWIRFLLGQDDESLKTYKSCTEKPDAGPDFFHHLGQVALKCGDAALARRSFEKALDLSNTFDGVKDAIRQLEELPE